MCQLSRRHHVLTKGLVSTTSALDRSTWWPVDHVSSPSFWSVIGVHIRRFQWSGLLCCTLLCIGRGSCHQQHCLITGLRCLCERVYVMSQRKYHTCGTRIPFSTVPLLSGGCADVRMLASCGWYTAILPHLLVDKVLYSLPNHWRLAPSNVGPFFNYWMTPTMPHSSF